MVDKNLEKNKHRTYDLAHIMEQTACGVDIFVPLIKNFKNCFLLKNFHYFVSIEFIKYKFI